MIPKIIFIVPYRDRLNHKRHWITQMKYILEDVPKNNYEIFFIHQ